MKKIPSKKNTHRKFGAFAGVTIFILFWVCIFALMQLTYKNGPLLSENQKQYDQDSCATQKQIESLQQQMERLQKIVDQQNQKIKNLEDKIESVEGYTTQIDYHTKSIDQLFTVASIIFKKINTAHKVEELDEKEPSL